MMGGDMKTSLQSSPAVLSGINQADVSIMGMDNAGMRQACQVFRDAIYSDKIRAVVREWSCNAIDEHIKFDIAQPVEIGLENEEFFVRDYAKGLSEDGIRNIFGQYFRSTKSGSDDFIGGFGVGAKAGHCYADTFNVESYFEGTKTIYSCVLSADDDGASVGNIIKLHSEPTAESGLRVSIPVKIADEEKFRFEMIRAQRSSIRGIRVRIDSVPQEPISKELMFEKEGIKMFKFLGSGKLIVTMGGVEYKMNADDHSEFKIKEKGININKAIDIQIDVPVGLMDIPISREVIKPTVRSFATAEKIRGLFQEYFADQIETARNKTFGELLESYSGDLVAFSGKEITVNYSFFMDKEIISLFRNCDLAGETSQPIAKKGDKILCGLLPSSWSAQHRAMDIAKAYSRKHGVRVLCFNKRTFEGLSDENKKMVKGFAFFRSPQTFETAGVVRTKLNKDTFTVREGNVSKPVTALELHNLIHGVTHTEAEAKAFLADTSNIQNVKDATGFYFSGNKVDDFYIPSAKGQSLMIQLGYRRCRTADIADRVNALNAEAQKIREINQKTYERHSLMTKLGSKVRGKNLNRLNQYAAQVDAIISNKHKNGHMITYKILKNVVGSYRCDLSLTRAEVRKLIKLEV